MKSAYRKCLPGNPEPASPFCRRPPHGRPVLAPQVSSATDLLNPGCGPLRTPVQIVQQPSNMINVIAHAKAALNVLGHAGIGPQIAGKSRRLRALLQLFLQPLALTLGEFKRSSACRNRFQRRPTAQLHVMFPAAYAARVHIQPARDYCLRKPLFQQPDSALPFPLQLLRTASRTDTTPPYSYGVDAGKASRRFCSRSRSNSSGLPCGRIRGFHTVMVVVPERRHADSAPVPARIPPDCLVDEYDTSTQQEQHRTLLMQESTRHMRHAFCLFFPCNPPFALYPILPVIGLLISTPISHSKALKKSALSATIRTSARQPAPRTFRPHAPSATPPSPAAGSVLARTIRD